MRGDDAALALAERYLAQRLTSTPGGQAAWTNASLLGALDLSPKAERVGHVLVVSFLILSLTMVASTIVTRTLQKYGELHALPFAVAGLSRTLTQVIVFSLGLVIFLSYLGISPTPLITAWRARNSADEPVEQLLLTLTTGMPVMPTSYSARWPAVESP